MPYSLTINWFFLRRYSVFSTDPTRDCPSSRCLLLESERALAVNLRHQQMELIRRPLPAMVNEWNLWASLLNGHLLECGGIVWCKYKKYPYWPGIIWEKTTKSSRTLYEILFFGTFSLGLWVNNRRRRLRSSLSFLQSHRSEMVGSIRRRGRI